MTNRAEAASDPLAASTGLTRYLQMVRLFSYNARLYMLHIIGMDMIFGTWGVLFNLYLLKVGFTAEFIGLRAMLGGIAMAAAAIPAGYLSDRLGRKLSFILGDGIGAALSLVAIFSTNYWVLLLTPVVGALFSAMHGVAEPAFMAENSDRRERVHLFSVSSGVRTLAVMGGQLLVATLPITADSNVIHIYRWATVVGIAGWFLSLLPAVLLKQTAKPDEAPKVQPAAAQTGHDARETPSPSGTAFSRLQSRIPFLRPIRNPLTVLKLVLVSATVAAGAGFVIPLFNLYFHEGMHAHEHTIGHTFAIGSAMLSFSALLAPFVADRLGKVRAILITRALSVPWIVVMAISPGLSAQLGPALTLAGLAYVLRTVFFNMGGPIYEAFQMEILHPGERATMVGMAMLVSSILGGLATRMGGLWMAAGDYRTPLVAMAAFYLISVLLFWVFFRHRQAEPASA